MELELERYWDVVRGRAPQTPKIPLSHHELLLEGLKQPRGPKNGRFMVVMDGAVYEGSVIDYAHLDGFGMPNEILARVNPVRVSPSSGVDRHG